MRRGRASLAIGVANLFDTGAVAQTETVASLIRLQARFREHGSDKQVPELGLAHETMRLMIEKGLPVPVELINPPPPVKPPKSDLRRGLVWRNPKNKP